jgi:hypothetical protein
MLEVSDVDLMRLADGTLAEPRLSAVEAEVATRPELQGQLEAYLVTGKALADLFSPIAEAPVPERLLATIRTGASAPSMLLHRTAPHRNVPAASRLRDWFAGLLQPDWRLSPMAAASALAMVGAIGAAIMLTEPQNSFVGPASGALADALEKVPTNPDGTTIGWPSSGGATFVVDLSFKHKDGRFCRQYYLGLNNDTRAFVGFACSDGNGNWSVEKDAASPVRTASNAGDVRPLEGPTSAVDEAVNNVMVGDALEITREHALIQQGWPREKQ